MPVELPIAFGQPRRLAARFVILSGTFIFIYFLFSFFLSFVLLVLLDENLKMQLCWRRKVQAGILQRTNRRNRLQMYMHRGVISPYCSLLVNCA